MTTPPPSRIAVVGAGVMGSEIAQVAAAAGLDVVLLDADPAALARGMEHLRGIGERRVARGRMDEAAAHAALARVTATIDDAALASCGLAVEAVPEVLEIKLDVFRRLDDALSPGALLATNTSGLSVTALAEATSRPDRVLGLHFFNPASVMRLVEVIRGRATSEETIAAGEALVSALGKVPVRVRECPGFLVNRILVRAMAEAYRRAEATGADRGAADAAVRDAGPAPMGPFELADLIGLDTLSHIIDDLEEAYGARFADGGAVAREVAAGRLGRKSGAGFDPGPAPEGEPGEAAREVADAYYGGALDEARRCRDERVAAPGDIDLAMRHGAGWEAGPLAWAEGSTPDH
ncbi:3-hydroxyacyl-CoA dehydrogenase [Miltoncostaea marina]|uniref:3-hydroxyacyl-CoA dehydrogenase n=1 Tax=Miltoncostaea marina TaxID=2843215 RepID=UPI001C3DCDB6|nr:3-hydroxyacyl-CoA dehydrogenase [Miltoncostaea marina]